MICRHIISENINIPMKVGMCIDPLLHDHNFLGDTKEHEGHFNLFISLFLNLQSHSYALILNS